MTTISMTQDSGQAQIATVAELALLLLSGQTLHRCHGQGWCVGDSARPVPNAIVKALTAGFRLVLGGDALPGFEPSLSQTARLDPLVPASEAMVMLNQAVRDAGGPAAYARAHGLSRSQVSDVTCGHKGMTPAVAQSLRLEPHVSYRRVRRNASLRRPNAEATISHQAAR
jgi:hypothetical protein